VVVADQRRGGGGVGGYAGRDGGMNPATASSGPMSSSADGIAGTGSQYRGYRGGGGGQSYNHGNRGEMRQHPQAGIQPRQRQQVMTVPDSPSSPDGTGSAVSSEQSPTPSEDQRQRIGCILYDMVQKQYSDLSKQFWAKITGMLLQSKPLDDLERELDNKPVVQKWITGAYEFLMRSLQANGTRLNPSDYSTDKDGAVDSSSSPTDQNPSS